MFYLFMLSLRWLGQATRCGMAPYSFVARSKGAHPAHGFRFDAVQMIRSRLVQADFGVERVNIIRS